MKCETALEYVASFGWLGASQPAVLFSHINSAPATSHQTANSIFLSQQISTSHQPAERGHDVCAVIATPCHLFFVELKYPILFLIMKTYIFFFLFSCACSKYCRSDNTGIISYFSV
jgi:hypothetical protein